MAVRKQKSTRARRRPNGYPEHLPPHWRKGDDPPGWELLKYARNINERLMVLGDYVPDLYEPKCLGDDQLFLETGSSIPTLYSDGGEERAMTDLVKSLALASTPQEQIVAVVRHKRRLCPKHEDQVCADFITYEMIHVEYGYELDTYPVEAAAMVAHAAYLGAMTGNARALDLVVANRLPNWRDTPGELKMPWQVTGELRLRRDEAINAQYAEVESDDPEAG